MGKCNHFDGIDDLIIGAYGADSNGYNSGASYVVFGSTEGFPASLDLSTLDGSNGFVINGDGFDDLIIGARYADAYTYDPYNSSIYNSGVSYVISGSAEGFPASLNLSMLDGSNGFVINRSLVKVVTGVLWGLKLCDRSPVFWDCSA